MKKLLQIFVFALIITGNINASAYEVKNGIKCEPVWEISRNNGTYDAHFLANNYTYIRTATIYGDVGNEKVILSWSKPVGDSYYATLVIMNLYTGEIEKEVTLTYGGEPIEGLLCANRIGVDDFGNLWIASYVPSTRVVVDDALGNEIVTNAPLKIYVVSDVNNGICSCMHELRDNCDYDDHKLGESIDYCDIVGDITGVESHAVCVAPINSSGKHVARWKLNKGMKKWEGGFDGYTCWYCNYYIPETYPSDQSKWGTAMCYIYRDPYYKGNMFYIDGEYNWLSLYNTGATCVDGFRYKEDLAPNVDAMGLTEFGFKYKEEKSEDYFKETDRYFLAYAISNYNSSQIGCQFRIAEYEDAQVEGPLFENLKEFWSIPNIGFGTHEVSGAMNVNCLDSKKIIDDNGREGVLLLSYCCGNGVGLYLVADEKFNSDNFESSVQEIERVFTEISTHDGSIVISGASVGDNVLIYNTQGVLLRNVEVVGDDVKIEMPIGEIYVVKCNDTVRKIKL